MICQSIYSLIFVVPGFAWKTFKKTDPNTKFLPIFNVRNNDFDQRQTLIRAHLSQGQQSKCLLLASYAFFFEVQTSLMVALVKSCVLLPVLWVVF